MNTIPGISSESLDVFEPGLYSLEELDFVAVNVGKPPAVVFHGALPAGVNPNQVRPLIERIYELEQIREYKHVEWCGVRAVTEAIVDFLDWMQQCEDIVKQGGPKHASTFSWDGDGSGHKYGPGSDAGVVRSRITETGERKRFAVKLTHTPDFALFKSKFKPTFTKARTAPTALIVDDEIGRVECPICGHTTNFDPQTRATRNLAHTQMARHCKISKKEQGLHRALYTSVFGTKDAHVG